MTGFFVLIILIIFLHFLYVVQVLWHILQFHRYRECNNSKEILSVKEWH